MTVGVEADVLGLSVGRMSEVRHEVLAAHPRPGFKTKILQAFYDGMRDRPETTFCRMNDDVLAHFDPALERENFVDVIRQNSWSE